MIERYKDSTILVAHDNFGCGSSREHAPWAILDYGFHVVIAPSFADIFHNNCFKNGILPIKLTVDEVESLLSKDSYDVAVNLEAQTVTGARRRRILIRHRSIPKTNAFKRMGRNFLNIPIRRTNHSLRTTPKSTII